MSVFFRLALMALLGLLPPVAGAQAVPSLTVQLDAMTAPVGADLSVLLGPEAPRAGGDRIRIARPGAAADDVSGGEALVPAEGPASIRAPLEPGAWELRYVAQEAAGPVVLGASTLSAMPEDWKRDARGLAPPP